MWEALGMAVLVLAKAVEFDLARVVEQSVEFVGGTTARHICRRICTLADWLLCRSCMFGKILLPPNTSRAASNKITRR
jgi:hypothetical protein